MASVHFYLKNSWSENKVEEAEKFAPEELEKYWKTKLQIICSVAASGKRTKAYTGKRIAPKFWDSEQERSNTKLYRLYGTDLNTILNDLNTAATKHAEAKENLGEAVSIEELRLLIKPEKSKNSIEKLEPSFEDRFKFFLENHKTSSGFPIRGNTKKVYTTLKKFLLDFSKKKSHSLKFDKIDKHFVSEFQSYLNNGVSIFTKKRMVDSSKAKYIMRLKTFIKFYQEREQINLFRMSDIKVSQKGESEIYVLSLQKLLKLQSEEIEDDRLSKARDLFCFMCWTGQRISDYRGLDKSAFIKNDQGILHWKLSAKKSTLGRMLSVPIIEYAREIYSKNDGPPQLTVSDDKFRAALKDLGAAVEFNFPVKKIKYYNGMAKIDTVQFFEVMTPHVARKTFITNSLILGVPERVVKEISDHKDEKSFRRYINLADSYKTAKLMEAYSRDNVERVLQQIGNDEKFSELDITAQAQEIEIN